MNLPNKKIFYALIVGSALVGYLVFFGLQQYVTTTIQENLLSIKSCEYHIYTIKQIEKRIELNTKAKLTKNDYIISFEETERKFRTYTNPKTNPEQFNFQKYFNQDLQIGDSVEIQHIIPKLESEIYEIPIIGLLLEKDYTLLIEIFPKNKAYDSRYYNRDKAFSVFCKIDKFYQILTMVLFILFGVWIYYKKFYFA